ncbi:MATE family efflux transporter [Gallalistipes aquisgranensis]|uniref:MATE family efflux transporter n=1 Tax=Gallalistipes aquisgranensis TaxID=2779358 RepID=UPI001CF815C2|nr:MATE family efflux transporter [Gallalistipes aquisgranensis]MBE5034215.1 MATE family efflux transporter [Gallalistipes aquisgranensis]
MPNFFDRYRDQYRRNLALAIPVVLSQAGQVVVQLVDNAMVGRLGALPLAAVSFGGSVFFMLMIVGVGISLGLTPLVGVSFSQRDHRSSAVYLQNAVLLYGILSLVLFGLSQAIVPFMHRMGQPPEVVEMAIPYFNYIAWSLIPLLLFLAFKQFLEGVGNTRVAMTIIISSNLVNIVFNYLFIYGKFGFPEMGAAGAGLATLISRIITPVWVILYFRRKASFNRYFTFFRWGNFAWKRIRALLTMGIPISMQMFMEGSAFVLTGIMMGWIGTYQIAGHQITTVISNLAFMIVLGIGAATTIRVSHEYGQGNPVALKLAATASYHIGLAWNVFTALVFILLRNYIPLLFTSDPEVVKVASTLLLFAAMFQISDGLQVISIGILRGLQDVKITTVIAFFSYIVINLPAGYFFAFVLGLGAPGLWMGLILGLSVAAVLLIQRFRRQYARLVARTPAEGARK